MMVTKRKFKQYVKQQKVQPIEGMLIGSYNMFDPRARMNTDLSRTEWTLCIKYYDELYDKHITSEDEAEIDNMVTECL